VPPACHVPVGPARRCAVSRGPAVPVDAGTAPRSAVVAAGHQATVDASLEVLEDGGNAYDAAVAAGFAAAVAEPCLSSLGGGGFLLARPSTGPPVLFDFFVDTPGRGRPAGTPPPPLTPATLRFGNAEQVFHVGHGSVAVPGCLPGYLHVHRRLGRLPLARVVAPAQHLARVGVRLGPDQAAVVRLLEPIFSLTPEARALFVPEHRAFADDDLVRNHALARFLDAIGDGEVSGFHDPALARAIAAHSQAEGGSLTVADLVGYRVQERTPLTFRHADATVLTNPVPSYGGSLIARALTLLARAGLAGAPGSGARLAQVASVLAEVTAIHVAAGVDATEHGGEAAATPDRPGPAASDGSSAPDGAHHPRTARGTTHVSIADAQGNLAAMTTSNGSGSGVTLSDTGVLANNIMGETDLHPGGFHRAPPGVRVGSMMAPTILEPDTGAAVALGSGGSERIRSALTQVLVGLLDDGRTLEEAVLAPRLHWDGTMLQVEPGFDETALAELERTWAVNRWELGDLYFGGVNVVTTAGDAVGDPRRGGRTGRLTEPA
jgi:gamma-glutamyltranspeptidase / glutathione hydrolase